MWGLAVLHFELDFERGSPLLAHYIHRRSRGGILTALAPKQIGQLGDVGGDAPGLCQGVCRGRWSRAIEKGNRRARRVFDESGASLSRFCSPVHELSKHIMVEETKEGLIRRWTLHHRSDKSLENLGEKYNPLSKAGSTMTCSP